MDRKELEGQNGGEGQEAWDRLYGTLASVIDSIDDTLLDINAENVEIWKEIPGYEGSYEVSTFGNVRSLDRTVHVSATPARKAYSYTAAGRQLSQVDHDGYCCVTLYDESNRPHTYKVHRLVMLAFVYECPDGMTVNHRDEDKSNNRLDNLEYLSTAENTRYSRAIPVSALVDGEVVREYPSIDSTAADGFTPECVRRCAYGFRSQHAGYEWQLGDSRRKPSRMTKKRRDYMTR